MRERLGRWAVHWGGCAAIAGGAAVVGAVPFGVVAGFVAAFVNRVAPAYAAVRFNPANPEHGNWFALELIFAGIWAGFVSTGVLTLLILGNRWGRAMTVLRAYIIVIFGGVLGAAAGYGLGGWLGQTVPNFYRTQFPSSATKEWFDPVQVGVGLGVSEGMFGGVIVGLVIVLAVTWCEVRKMGQGNVSEKVLAGPSK